MKAEIREDAFQRVADTINDVVRVTVAANLPVLLKQEMECGEGDCGPLLVAAIAGIISAAGVIAAGFEPTLKSDVLSGMVQQQFDAGRADGFAAESGVRQ